MFVDVVADSTLQLAVKKLKLSEFWCTIREDYPELFEKTSKILLSFQSTYFIEVGFSYTS